MNEWAGEEWAYSARGRREVTLQRQAMETLCKQARLGSNCIHLEDMFANSQPQSKREFKGTKLDLLLGSFPL